MTNFDLNSLLFHSAETLAFRILSIWKRGHSLGRVIAEKYVRGECFSWAGRQVGKVCKFGWQSM